MPIDGGIGLIVSLVIIATFFGLSILIADMTRNRINR